MIALGTIVFFLVIVLSLLNSMKKSLSIKDELGIISKYTFKFCVISHPVLVIYSLILTATIDGIFLLIIIGLEVISFGLIFYYLAYNGIKKDKVRRKNELKNFETRINENIS